MASDHSRGSEGVKIQKKAIEFLQKFGQKYLTEKI